MVQTEEIEGISALRGAIQFCSRKEEGTTATFQVSPEDAILMFAAATERTKVEIKMCPATVHFIGEQSGIEEVALPESAVTPILDQFKKMAGLRTGVSDRVQVGLIAMRFEDRDYDVISRFFPAEMVTSAILRLVRNN
jgi:hypothetical protein